MKILHILNELKYSGAEIMYVDAAPIFQEKGCELSVMATSKELGEFAINFKKAGYTVLHLPMPVIKKYFKRLWYYRKIITLLNSEKYQVVHIHSSGAMWGFALCARLTNTKSIYTFHNVFPTHFYSYPYHVFLRWSAKYLFQCKFHAISDSVYNNELKLYHNNTTKIYNWYGNKRYFPSSPDEKISIRRELGIDIDSLVVISVGGCSIVKRHSDIITALPLILDKIPNTIYLHLGFGETQGKEKNLALSLGIGKNVWFCNNQEDVRKYLIASDIYLMPSRFEGISITTIEAMACRIPTILYDVPGLRDFNKEGKHSILIAEDFKVLANAVVEMVANPKGTEMMINNAKLSVDKLYNLQTNANEIYELYS